MKAVIGKTCPYCQTPIKPGESVVFCSACSIPHHQQCWDEARGCTTFGCSGNPSIEPSNQHARNILTIDMDVADTNVSYCSHCGSPINDRAVYCSRCGTSFQNVTPSYTGENNWTNARHASALVGRLVLLSVFLLLIVVIASWVNEGARDDTSINRANNNGESDIISEDSFELETDEVLENEQEEVAYHDEILENDSNDGALNPIKQEENLDSTESLNEHQQTDLEPTQNYDVLPQEDNYQFTPTKANFEKTNSAVIYFGCYDDTYTFRTTFSKARTKTITAELGLIHPSPYEIIYFDLLYIVVSADGTLLDSYVQNTRIEPGWTESYHTVTADNLEKYGLGTMLIGVFDGEKLLASHEIELTE